MAANGWKIDFSGLDSLQAKLQQLPGEGEDILNKVLHGEGVELTKSRIRERIPVSTWKGRARGKKHARNVDSLRSEEFNLGFIIRPKPAFKYLVFPDLAVGQSKRNRPEEFMTKGLDATVQDLKRRMDEELMKVINKKLGGN